MRIGARHWLTAAALSLAGHVAVVAIAATRAPEVEMERSAGAPGDVWGMPVESIADTVAAVDPVAESATEPTEAETVEDAPESQPAETPEPEAVEAESEPTSAETTEAEITEEAEAAPMAGEPVLPSAPQEVEAVEEIEEVRTAALPEAKDLEEVTTTDITTPLPPVRPANVPRYEPPPEPVRQAEPEPRRQEAPQRRQEVREARRQPAAGAAAPAGQQAGNSGRRQTQGGQADVSNYSGRVVAHLQRHKRYPREAARQRMGGTATLTFTIGSNGSVQGARLSGGSGHQPLDAEAIAMVQRASPFPPIPQQVGRSSMTFTVPVRFAPR